MPALAKNYTVIAPDLRVLGDFPKPHAGYDGKTTAEDINQLVSQLGFKQIFLVGHDVGSQPAYSYAASNHGIYFSQFNTSSACYGSIITLRPVQLR